MSITIRPIIETECECAKYMKDGQPDHTCQECEGSGFVSDSMQNLRMTNIRFNTIWSALGFDVRRAGFVGAETLIKAIDSYIPGLAVMDDGYYAPDEHGVASIRVSDQHPEPKTLIVAMSEEMVQERLTAMRKLAILALAHDTNLSWSE